MIRMVLQGRTGNSLFQYAAAKWLANEHSTKVLLDGSFLSKSEWRQALTLKDMGVDAEFSRLPKWFLALTKNHIKCHPYEYVNKYVYRESLLSHAYDLNFKNLPDGSLLIGFFQTSRYFPNMRKQLQQDINYRALPMDCSTAEVAEAISCPNTVSIHVRRGDYKDLKGFDVCGLLYYQRAISKAREILKHPIFWVFSDDIPWCREHFLGVDFNFVELEYSRNNHLNDMRLMSLADNHIIANSSYSWWAAWLYWNPSKVVIMPDCWSLDPDKVPIEDKKEDGWIAISPL